jgi:hypothetical protein
VAAQGDPGGYIRATAPPRKPRCVRRVSTSGE